jgi:hypothetical protein
MKLAILGATGRTGRELVRQSLDRGHDVIALVRDPMRTGVPEHPQLRRLRIDLQDPASLRAAIDAQTTVLSGLGNSDGALPGALAAGAHAVLAARPARVIWLGAIGTGTSEQAGGWAVRLLFRLFMRSEMPDKLAADSAVLRSGGTVFHAGPLTNGPMTSTRRTVDLLSVPRRFFPASISRANVAALMLDEAEKAHFVGQTVVPLAR